MSLPRSSRRSIRILACFTAASALVLTGLAGPAQAVAPDPKPAKPLPAVGTSFDLDVTSDGIEFTIDDQVLTSAPLRGTLTVAIEANPSDRKKLSVEAKPSDLRLTTKAAQTHAITVEQDNAIVDEKSVLKLVKAKPVKLAHVMVLDLRFTVTMVATPAEAEQTRVFDLKMPAYLKAELKSFPPKNQAYSLQEPVELVAESGAATPSTVLTGFDVIVNRA